MLDKLDTIEAIVAKLTSTMSGLEKRVDENEINVKDLEQHDEMRSKYDKIKEIEKYVQT